MLSGNEYILFRKELSIGSRLSDKSFTAVHPISFLPNSNTHTHLSNEIDGKLAILLSKIIYRYKVRGSH